MINLTGFTDGNIKDIKLGNKVDLFGMKGDVVIECGAIGLGIKGGIDYELIQSKMDEDDLCCGNKYSGCFNDNFVTFWELHWNFNCEEDHLYMLEVINKQ